MRFAPAIASLLATSLVLAGCAQPEDDAEPFETADGTADKARGNETLPPGNTTGGNGSANMTGQPTSANDTNNATQANETENGTADVQEEERAGTAESFNLIVTSDETEEPFDVPAGAAAFEIEFSVSDAVDVCIYVPDADDCVEELSADEGENATFEAQSPAAGEWVVGLTPGGLGPSEADYTITFRVTADAGGSSNATGNGTGAPSPTAGSTAPSNTTAASPTTTATTRPSSTSATGT